ncbi:hypothetical protein RRG08_009906, partial [Elysia crispata]
SYLNIHQLVLSIPAYLNTHQLVLSILSSHKRPPVAQLLTEKRCDFKHKNSIPAAEQSKGRGAKLKLFPRSARNLRQDTGMELPDKPRWLQCLVLSGSSMAQIPSSARKARSVEKVRAVAGPWPRPTPTAETDQQVGPVSSARDGDPTLRVESIRGWALSSKGQASTVHSDLSSGVIYLAFSNYLKPWNQSSCLKTTSGSLEQDKLSGCTDRTATSSGQE